MVKALRLLVPILLLSLFVLASAMSVSFSSSPPCIAWGFVSSYPLAHAEAAVATDGTYAYVFGGTVNGSGLPDGNRYDPRNNSWTPLQSMPNGNESRFTADYGGNGKIYVMGGANNASLNRVYDTATNAWSTAASVPIPITYQGHAFYNGKIYVIGGRSGVTPVNTLFSYDVAANSWAGLAPMPGNRYGAASAVIDGKIYIAGGTSDGFDTTNTLFIYDIASNSWSSGMSMSATNRFGSGAVFGNQFWVLGGGNSAGTVNTTQIYDPATNVWSAGPSLLQARAQAGAVTVNGFDGPLMVVIGGLKVNPTVFLSTVEATTSICPTPTPTPTPITPTPTPTPEPTPTGTPTPVPTPIPTGPIIRDGTPDATFSLQAAQKMTGGVNAMVPGPGGRIYVGGIFGAIYGVLVKNIALLNYDGTVDTNFNVGAGPNGIVRRIHKQADGKILVSGTFTTFNGIARNSIVRLNTDGSVDTSFNVANNGSLINVCDIQSDGRILVAGNFSTVNGIARKQVARLDQFGNTDLSFDFGTGVPGSEFVNVIKILADGKMLIGGNISSVNSTPKQGIARLNADGTVDPAFTAGIGISFIQYIDVLADSQLIVTSLSRVVRLFPNGDLDNGFISDNNFSTPRFTIAQSDGKIIVGGGFSIVRIGVNTTSHRGLVRLNTDGNIDTTFTSSLGSADVHCTLLDQAGKLTVGGDFTEVGGIKLVGLARLNLNGSHDPVFFGIISSRSVIHTSLAEPDGKIFVGGSFEILNTSSRKYLGRVNADGSVDNSFIPDPILGGPIETAVRQPDGKYVVGGSMGPGGNQALWRLNADGSRDLGFTPPTFSSNSFVTALALQPDGKILVGGNFSSINGITRNVFARLNADGTLDSLSPSFAGSSGQIEGFIVQADAKIILGGTFGNINGSTGIQNLARLNVDGTVDLQFTQNHGGTFDAVRSLAAIGGNIYVGSRFAIAGGSDSRSPLIKVSTAGVVDLAFNSGRVVGSIYSIAALPHGKFLVGGTFNTFAESDGPSGSRRSIVRLLENGGLDYTFDVGGLVHNNGPASEVVFTVTTLPNNKAFIGGAFDSIASRTAWSAARLNINQNVTRAVSDLDGDAKTDISVYRPSNGTWYWRKSFGGTVRAAAFGISTDLMAPSDFDSDGITDIALFRPSNGFWYVLKSSDSTVAYFNFGAAGDVPVPADYDGDGKADHAVYRPSTTVWYIARSAGGTVATSFGTAGDLPVNADYDGDGRADIAIYRPNGTNGSEWWVQRSSNGTVFATQFGQPTDKTVPGDYTGDGKADIAFWTPSNGSWFVLRSEDFSYFAFPFGTTTDIPAPGDYDSDGKMDAAVFRPSNSTWFANRSTAGVLIQQFGITGDLPVPSVFVR